VIAIAGGILFFSLPRMLSSIFIDTRKPEASAVLDFATHLVVVAGIFQLVDGLQAIASGLLRGLKDARVPMVMALIAYWPIGFFLAWLMAFPLGLGGVGIWLGFLVGLGSASFLLCARFYLRVRYEMRTARQ